MSTNWETIAQQIHEHQHGQFHESWNDLTISYRANFVDAVKAVVGQIYDEPEWYADVRHGKPVWVAERPRHLPAHPERG